MHNTLNITPRHIFNGIAYWVRFVEYKYAETTVLIAANTKFKQNFGREAITIGVEAASTPNNRHMGAPITKVRAKIANPPIRAIRLTKIIMQAVVIFRPVTQPV